MENLTFREFRNYLSVIDRLSICMLETLAYENYVCLEEVPHTYDDYYVYGVGMIESEFYKVDKYAYAASGDRKDLVLATCIEVMLSKAPKSFMFLRHIEGRGIVHGHYIKFAKKLLRGISNGGMKKEKKSGSR